MSAASISAAIDVLLLFAFALALAIAFALVVVWFKGSTAGKHKPRNLKKKMKKYKKYSNNNESYAN